MKSGWGRFLAGCVGVLVWVAPLLAAEMTILPAQRMIAVTFDDLPFVVGGRRDAELRPLSTKLLHQITSNGIPAVGFVNEKKLYPSGELSAQGVAILEDWLTAGLDLGNHTYSHASLNRIPLADYIQDVVRGEAVTGPLMAKHGMTLRYFRHPFLQVGKDAQTRAEFEQFLAGRGYIVAPVTVNSSEWIFAAAYDKAMQQGDAAAMQQVADAYVPYMELTLAEAERQSMELFGYEIRQILLLHANALNAAHLGELAKMLKKRGYRFITLDEALQDRAYSSPNRYTGWEGESWLNQWAQTVGLRPRRVIQVPAFVRALAGRADYTGD